MEHARVHAWYILYKYVPYDLATLQTFGRCNTTGKHAFSGAAYQPRLVYRHVPVLVYDLESTISLGSTGCGGDGIRTPTSTFACRCVDDCSGYSMVIIPAKLFLYVDGFDPYAPDRGSQHCF